jgi:hypothetical protein
MSDNGVSKHATEHPSINPARPVAIDFYQYESQIMPEFLFRFTIRGKNNVPRMHILPPFF